ncbi:MAG: L-serine ammonia-lyase [Anaeromyxobacter sp.]
MTSVFELFKIGIGPSSSHTVGPMVAARRFGQALAGTGGLGRTAEVTADLHGSLGATGRGHGTGTAVMLGLLGEAPDTLDPDAVPGLLQDVRGAGALALLGRQPIAFAEDRHLRYLPRPLPFHPNGLTFTARDAGGGELLARTWFSVGGGFVIEEGASPPPPPAAVPLPFRSGRELLDRCAEGGLAVSEVMRRNEASRRPHAEVEAGLLRIWRAMESCVERGCRSEGTLPGGLDVPRRAPALHRVLATGGRAAADPLAAMDWVNLWALAVNEENAAGGRVVTAPTNGAAGVIPAVLHYYRWLVPGAGDAA